MSEQKGAWSSVPIDMRWHYGCPPLPLKEPREKPMRTNGTWVFILAAIAFVALMLLLIFSVSANAMHGDWTDHYKSVNDVPCCHLERDCLPTQVRIIKMEDGVVTAEVAGEVIMLPQKSVHLSEEMTTYRCRRWGQPEDKVTSDNTRCIFFSIGM